MAQINVADLKAVNLKKAKPNSGLKKKEEAKFSEQLCETSDDYYRLVKESYFENYYDQIKDLTFPTDYIELSIDDCKELISLHEIYLKNTKNEEKKDDDIDTSKLSDLIKKIDDMILKKKWKYCFIRMSIRSPKDSALTLKKFEKIIDREFKSLQKSQGEKAPKNLNIKGGDSNEIWRINQKIIACYRAQTFALAIQSGKEAIDLLIRSNRIQGDMKDYIDGTYKQKFQLVLREFHFFDVSFEFRSFVHKGKLTGLTQYNDLCYFDDLVKFEKQVVKKIDDFIQLVIKNLENGKNKMESFVLDIVLVDVHYNIDDEWPILTLERLNDLKCYVIELNPLAEFAGSGLFSWSQDKDVILGEKPFEFRIQKKLSKYVSADLMDEWKPFIFGN